MAAGKSDGPASLAPFDLKSAVPLVTGGGTGIGLGLVEEFFKAGCEKALITGRREEVLKAASEKYPGKIHYLVSDAGSAKDREALFAWVCKEHPDCNAVVNNAGIQRRVAPCDETAPWEERAQEIEINLSGPVHLCSLFAPWLVAQNRPAMIANVTSGLAFIPFPCGPVYSATKAAMHSYTMSLR
mmetsp:Transcript_19612/g.52035  ORF Transcript_19612/g.52035 Transcript_19612/m.52035 type:complete len:185 (-) Transcript_19612:386-940(-)